MKIDQIQQWVITLDHNEACALEHVLNTSGDDNRLPPNLRNLYDRLPSGGSRNDWEV